MLDEFHREMGGQREKEKAGDQALGESVGGRRQGLAKIGTRGRLGRTSTFQWDRFFHVEYNSFF